MRYNTQILIILLIMSNNVLTQSSPCPVSMQPDSISSLSDNSRCSCFSDESGKISIFCDSTLLLEQTVQEVAQSAIQFIDKLTIINSPIYRLQNQFANLPPTKNFILRNNNLSYVDPQAFTRHTNSLEELEISENQLTNIPFSSLIPLRNLNVLMFSGNKISNIPDGGFFQLQSRLTITKLNFESNELERINPQALFGLDNLQQLFFSKNKLHYIPSEALKHVRKLQEISFSANSISTVPNGALDLPELRSLSLEANKISEINANGFLRTPNLVYLYLGGNLFEKFPSQMLRYMQKLKVLSIQNSKGITNLKSHDFGNVASLLRIDLSYCMINDMAEDAFEELENIQVITLRGNKLTRIKRKTFQMLKNIVSIDLADNQIATIDDFAFSDLPEIKYLDLSGNKLNTLPKNILKNSLQATNPATTRTFYLYKNPWRCDLNLAWLQQWLRENPDLQTAAPGYSSIECLNGISDAGTNISIHKNLESTIYPVIASPQTVDSINAFNSANASRIQPGNSRNESTNRSASNNPNALQNNHSILSANRSIKNVSLQPSYQRPDSNLILPDNKGFSEFPQNQPSIIYNKDRNHFQNLGRQVNTIENTRINNWNNAFTSNSNGEKSSDNRKIIPSIETQTETKSITQYPNMWTQSIFNNRMTYETNSGINRENYFKGDPWVKPKFNQFTNKELQASNLEQSRFAQHAYINGQNHYLNGQNSDFYNYKNVFGIGVTTPFPVDERSLLASHTLVPSFHTTTDKTSLTSEKSEISRNGVNNKHNISRSGKITIITVSVLSLIGLALLSILVLRKVLRRKSTENDYYCTSSRLSTVSGPGLLYNAAMLDIDESRKRLQDEQHPEYINRSCNQWF